MRVFGQEGATGLRDWHLRVSGGAELDMPFRAILLPRQGTVAWTADLDGDGSPEWVLESQKVRAVFATREGGRWLELTWKDTNTNFLPVDGLLAQPGPVEVHAKGDALEFVGNSGTRTVRLTDASLTIEQSAPLPMDSFSPETIGNLRLMIERHSPSRVTYEIQQAAP